MPSNLSHFPALFEKRAASIDPNREFITGTISLSYGKLFEKIERTGGYFESLGLAVGDRVVVMSADDLEVAVLYLAMLRYGLTAIVIDPHASVAEAIVLISASDPNAIFVDIETAEDIESAAADTDAHIVKIGKKKPAKSAFGLLRRKSEADAGADMYPEVAGKCEPRKSPLGDIPEDSTALILFTSGTTSQPKGVELTFRNLYAQFDTFEKHYGFESNSRIVNHLPLHHTDGLNQGPAICLFVGGTWIRTPAVSMQSLPEIVDSIYRDRATHMITVPTVLALMIRLPSEYDDSFSTPDFLNMLSTAGYLEEALWKEFESRFSATIVNSYGLTETVSEAIYCGPSPETRRMGTIGKPIDCEARVVDDQGNTADPGIVGELVLRGDNVMKGYFRNPAATAEVVRDGWFHTGDLATVDTDGFFSIVGRKKNVIIRGGVNVYPEDVSTTVLQLPGILDAVTIGLPDDLLGEKVVTGVTLDGSTELTTLNVIDYCRQQLAPEKIPNDVYILDEMPRGPAGKIVLQEVKAIIRQISDGGDEHVEGSIETQVITLAASVFKVAADALDSASDEQSTESWDSLSHLELIMRVERHFGIKLSPRDVMSISNLSDVIRIVEKLIDS